MPKIDLSITAGALPELARSELPGKLAATLLRWEGAPDTEFFRQISWTHVHELTAGQIHDAAGPTTLEHVVADVTVPQGALSDRRKEGLVKELTEQITEATGLDAGAAVRVWVLIHEVPDGNWGAAGGIIRFEQLRAAAKAEREAAGANA